jgi:hypothetical protein
LIRPYQGCAIRRWRFIARPPCPCRPKRDGTF